MIFVTNLRFKNLITYSVLPKDISFCSLQTVKRAKLQKLCTKMISILKCIYPLDEIIVEAGCMTKETSNIHAQ